MCSTPSSSARPTSGGASGWWPWCNRAPDASRRSRISSRTAGRRSRATRCRARCISSSASNAPPAANPTTPGPKNSPPPVPETWGALLAFEVGGALLGEGAGAFLGVLGGEDRPAELELVGQRVGLGHLRAFAERLEHGLHRQRRVGGDLIGDLASLGQRLSLG